MTLCGGPGHASRKITHRYNIHKMLSEVFYKMAFLKLAQNSPENTCVRASFVIKLQALDLKFYSKRDTGTDVFL